jgi:L-ribulose-5-phosphate 4-epimerase
MNSTLEIREKVLKANLDIVKAGLVKFTWGNASAVDRANGKMYIKPSGVDYAELTAENIVEVSLDTGLSEEGYKASTDTPTHLYLYKCFPQIGGIVHTHSPWATSWAQACREIPCLGTTHADHFYGSVPITRPLASDEIDGAYEHNTGIVIEERFKSENPMELPGVLVAEHGPFTWGKDIKEAVQHAIILEEIARIAFQTIQLGKEWPVNQVLLDKHYKRKNGPDSYYGQ